MNDSNKANFSHNIIMNQIDLDLMLHYLHEKLPEEACGLLYGKQLENCTWHIEQFEPVPNTAADKLHHFYLDPAAWVKASYNEKCIGLIHSHPTTLPLPSSEDLRQLEQFGGMIHVYLIASPCGNESNLISEKWNVRAYIIKRAQNQSYHLHPISLRLA